MNARANARRTLKGSTAINQHMHVQIDPTDPNALAPINLDNPDGPLALTALVTVAELQQMAEDGGITFDRIKAALIKQGHSPERVAGQFRTRAVLEGIELEFI